MLNGHSSAAICGKFEWSGASVETQAGRQAEGGWRVGWRWPAWAAACGLRRGNALSWLYLSSQLRCFHEMQSTVPLLVEIT